ncbi:MAG TPA: LysM peptidoglycan-binding domain-containing protein [Chloroflexia bacterium]|nr:LysM peptidoglycan-binding domain-containing protein [Chloroflexia bacterium]
MRHNGRPWGKLFLLVLVGLVLVAGAVSQTIPAYQVHVDLGLGSEAPTAMPTRVQLTAPTVLPAAPSATPRTTPLAAAPATTPGTMLEYTIRDGDTLSGIAAQFGTTVAAIQARNQITNPNLLFVGARLQIMPGELPPVAALPTRGPPASPTAVRAAAPPVVPPAPVAAATPAAMSALEPTRPAQPPSAYDVYVTTASKSGQYFHYTCEFDAAWAIFKTYGLDVSLTDQLQLVGLDTSVEPAYRQTAEGVEITGGDIANAYSGDYEKNFLARTTGEAMRKVFEHYGLATTPVHDQAGIVAALRAGQLVWIKTTVDFQRWVPATWVGPDGRRYPTVLGNDHAVVVAGFNSQAVLIRDVLGPTSTNANRLEEYEVSWPTFLAAWGAQGYDGLAVARAAAP